MTTWTSSPMTVLLGLISCFLIYNLAAKVVWPQEENTLTM